MRYAFIGLGNMAGAILAGMKKSGRFERDAVWGYDTDAARTEAFRESCGLVPAASVGEAVREAETVVLAVKPQVLEDVLPKVREALQEGALVITIAAGKPLSFYERRLGPQAPVIRVMPSINAKVGAAASALCGNAKATRDQLSLAVRLFESVGSVTEVREDLIPVFSAVGGAAPAFVFLFIDALASAGVRAGLARPAALRLAADTVLGSAMLLKSSGEHPCALADQVCSPGGTTIEGIHALKRLGFEHAVQEAVAAVLGKDRTIGGD